MFRFHQDGAEAGDAGLVVASGGISPGILWKKAHWKLGEGEVEVVPGGFVEDVLGEGGGGFGGGGADGPEDDVELGGEMGVRKCGDSARRWLSLRAAVWPASRPWAKAPPGV